MGHKYSKVEASLDYLETRGLIELFDDKAFVTAFGIECAKKDLDISELPKRARDWKKKSEPAPARPSAPAPTFRPEQPQLTQIDENGATSVHILGNRAVIGRSPEADIRTLDLRASKKHAEVSVEGGGYVLTDLGSANGTVINGEVLSRSRPLRHDDVFVVGTTQFVFQCPAELIATIEDGAPIGEPRPPKSRKSAAPPPGKQAGAGPKSRPAVKTRK
ncbi:MAG: FHA domain-containing protein [Deltaproteobacteria bacterium]|nr:FHA domain-containing protein [Deltaproteobacteria bacterium]